MRAGYQLSGLLSGLPAWLSSNAAASTTNSVDNAARIGLIFTRHFPCDARPSPPVGSNDNNTCLAFEQDCALLSPGRKCTPPQAGFAGMGVLRRSSDARSSPQIVA